MRSENRKISIEKALVSDAPVAWDIRARAISLGCKDVYPEEQLKIWIGSVMPEKFVAAITDSAYLAKIARKTIGTVMLNIQTARVDGLFVYPEYMARGVGRVLMLEVDKVAMKEGLQILSLESTLNAASFYRSCGFVGDVEKAYPTKNKQLKIDCVPMKKTLGI